MDASPPQMIDLSDRIIVEKDTSAEIELFRSTQLTTITIPVNNTFYSLMTKAAEIFRAGQVALFIDGEPVDVESTLQQKGIAVGDKKRVEVRYVEKEAPGQVELEKEQELIEKDTQPAEEVIVL